MKKLFIYLLIGLVLGFGIVFLNELAGPKEALAESANAILDEWSGSEEEVLDPTEPVGVIVEVPVPTPTLAVEPTLTVEPTPVVEPTIALGIVDPGYMAVRVPGVFVKIEDKQVIIDTSPSTKQVGKVDKGLLVIGDCGPSPVEAFKISMKLAQEYGIPKPVMGALMASESGYVHMVKAEGVPEGKCTLKVNPIGPAWGVPQIYRPRNGTGGHAVVHDSIDVADLVDYDYAMRQGISILLGMYNNPDKGGGNWDRAVYYYKGKYSHGLYYTLKEAGGLTLDGQWLPFE
ncbi:MAG: hypothetical protein UU77_C0026G0006 [candidate division WWE3 bacterium GW2011_GWC1_41_7]|uniref:Transglycosylase SLT domain-containing protein n=2 Tax=Katanobacteria TaxID=422282 RepID=A0A0G1A555_UNCKA|nr:MAG: hypothetical protein UU72_C0009G0015 [candidate division WWE3 bacterium GW2011_GWB1_41_6]KKS20508.1 MAG: hypothetical protein UU77_C0026G0006 [candidate division WWE3 bacterium GW2011_GWC1_41_7]